MARRGTGGYNRCQLKDLLAAQMLRDCRLLLLELSSIRNLTATLDERVGKWECQCAAGREGEGGRAGEERK